MFSTEAESILLSYF